MCLVEVGLGPWRLEQAVQVGFTAVEYGRVVLVASNDQALCQAWQSASGMHRTVQHSQRNLSATQRNCHVDEHPEE